MKFSVIVPVYRHWHLIPALLDFLQRQAFASEKFEVILVDNDSPDYSEPASLPGNARIVRCQQPGSYAARNLGARHAGGDWLVFTDADCLPQKAWLANLDKAIEDAPQNDLVAGSIKIISRTDKPSASEIFDLVKGIPQKRYVRRGYAATANLAVRRSTFEAVGEFDSQRYSGGDTEFCRRAKRLGHSISYVTSACVEHPARATWREITTKIRRIKGGQLTSGSTRQRIVWLMRTLVPPFRGAGIFLRSSDHPVKSRMIATFVLFGLWFVELFEMLKLATGSQAERE